MDNDKQERCTYCGVLLEGKIIAMGNLYCSRDCAINDTERDIINNAREQAIQIVNNTSEEIMLEDII